MSCVVLAGLLSVEYARGDDGAPSLQVTPAANAGKTPPGGISTSRLHELAVAKETKHFVVRLAGIADSDLRDELFRAGVELQRSLGGNAYLARSIPGRLKAETVAGMRSLVEILWIAPATKLHPVLRDRGKAAIWPRMAQPAGGGDDPVLLYVCFHDDVTHAEKEAVAKGFGGVIHGRVELSRTLIVEVPPGRIMSLAQDDRVRWIEPALPAWSQSNDGARAAVGADAAVMPPFDLSGSGVSVLVYDTGSVDGSHPDLTGRVAVLEEAEIQFHATHVAGTLGGTGAASGGQYRGIAPGAEIFSAAFDALGQGIALFADPGDLERDYLAGGVAGVSIVSNSIGPNLCLNGYACIYTGDYGVVSSLLDGLVRGDAGRPMTVVWSAGNERSCSRCRSEFVHTPEGYRSIPPPGCSKNPIVVGAIHSNDDSMTGFSSWGPCDDGRLKPDLVAPGCQSDGDRGITSCADGGGYGTLCGTSMSAPVVAGAAALLVEEFRRHSAGGGDPLNSTIKAALAQTAADLEPPGPDYRSGFGAMRAVDAIELIRGGGCIEGALNQGEWFTVTLAIEPEAIEVRVTLAWDDAAALENAGAFLVNDLDLVLFGPEEEAVYPWTLDDRRPGGAAQQAGPDRTNNIEQATALSPPEGSWRVEVRGFNVSHGPQRFSLCMSPAPVPCLSPASIWTDRKVYRCNDEVRIEVSDCSADRDKGRQDRVEVLVQRAKGSGPHRVEMTETAVASGVFRGNAQLSLQNADGSISVAHGDALEIEYEGGAEQPKVVKSIAVDCEAPAVTGVEVREVGPFEATIRVSIREAASVVVRFGDRCDGLDRRAAGALGDGSVLVRLSGLDEGRDYFFVVEVEDAAGNSVSHDSGGDCFRFRTADVPSSFTEQFVTHVDLAYTSLRFLPVDSPDSYAACAEPIAFLPVPVDGAIPLQLGDDEPLRVVLAAGRTFSFFGREFSEFFVSPNGNITFDESDSTYQETVSGHFRMPRVSALFRDLDPTAGGRVVFRELSDRAVVTWLGVPEHGQPRRNSFQIELQFNGRITISFLEVESKTGITGLSRGAGISADFREVDLSAARDCFPRAPYLEPMVVSTTENAPAWILLNAEDDGLPKHGLMRFVIDSLPHRGGLVEPGLGLIAQAPHELGLSRRGLVYIPWPGFVGEDDFAVIADDGGSPPDGGRSLPVRVSVMVAADCNGNRIADADELAADLAADCNGNGRLDDCDLVAGRSLDCNANGWPDECDVFGDAAGTYSAVHSPSLAVPDPGFVDSRIIVDQPGIVEELRVRLHIGHASTAQLAVILEHAGRAALLVNACPGGVGFHGTLLKDGAGVAICGGAGDYSGVFRPVQPLATFRGAAIAGEWRLIVRDRAAGLAGELTSWSLAFSADPDCGDDLIPDECACPRIIGDVDDDGDVDLWDWAVVQRCVGRDRCQGCVCAELTGDGQIDGADGSDLSIRLTGP